MQCTAEAAIQEGGCVCVRVCACVCVCVYSTNVSCSSTSVLIIVLVVLVVIVEIGVRHNNVAVVAISLRFVPCTKQRTETYEEAN